MKIVQFEPCPALRSYISKYIYLSNSTADTLVSNMIPRGYPALIFCYPDQPPIGNHFVSQERFYRSGHIYFSGLVTQNVKAVFPPLSAFIVALLKPHCSGLYFREDAFHFKNQLLDLTFDGPLNRDTADQLAHAQDINAKIAIIEGYLMRCFDRKPLCPALDRALSILPGYIVGMSVSDLASDVYVSDRSLRRKFIQHIGVSPKKFMSLVRFRSLVSSLQAKKDNVPEWWKSALDFGYYDLSHLSKDFQLYAGMSPSEYLVQSMDIDGKVIPKLP